MEGNYSLSDIAAITGENGLGGSNAFVLILLFAMIFGGNGFLGNRQSDFGQYATAASQQEILFGQQFQNLNAAVNKVGDGIASLGYSQLQQMDNIQTALGGAITNEGRALQQQISNCCCDNIKANAELATAIHAEGEATRSMMQTNRIADLERQVQTLQTQQMFCGVPKINPYGYGVYAYPQTAGCNCAGYLGGN